MVIRAIVYAENKEDALDKAEHIFQRLAGEDGQPFDYYTMFRDGDDKYGVSGKSRWGDLPAVEDANSDAGKKLIEEGMEYTEKEFEYALEQIKGFIDDGKTDDSMFRYYCSVAGQYQGSSIFLYDQDGEGIRDRKHLENVLNKWADTGIKSAEEYKNLEVFVVPADVHH
jgi:hypothetical protein